MRNPAKKTRERYKPDNVPKSLKKLESFKAVGVKVVGLHPFRCPYT